MKTFVTGGTGFLGSHLVDLLLAEGHEVTCLVRPTSNLQWLKNKPVRLVQGDLLPNNAGLREGLKNADWCFHSAGVISSTNPQTYFQVNVGGTRHCLDACLKSAPKLQRFVMVSSIAACGPAVNGQSLNEQTAPHPISIYGQSKLEAEKIAISYNTRLPVSVIRPPAIYGPRDTMIFPVFKMAQRGFFVVPFGRPRYITMAYVEDVAAACLWAAKEKKALGQIFFVADGDLYSWQDVADTLASVFYRKVAKISMPKTVMWSVALLEELRCKWIRKEPRLHRGHVKQFFASSWGIQTDKIRQAGFTPKFNLEAGMQATVAGYRQLGWL
ncbi:MAG: NAD-dependent epimerase/dehydratase family protein [Deltaproteobacteria bacterium]|nr:NAD-dependent epimerase/dehydratase family protein [Deltaproteobacteria bacterium]